MMDLSDSLRVALHSPPPFCSGIELPLQNVRLAVKDVIDVSGERTGAGHPLYLELAAPAEYDAIAVARLISAGARIIGKAHTDEFAFSLAGTNAHYGTPRNPAAPGRIPGGSSSGSASAVASGVADIALGTDTAGSIRVPASYCGIYGLRPTHGRVPLAGVLGLAPSFDVCGVLAASGELLRRAAGVLLEAEERNPPSRLVLPTDLLALADPPVRRAVALGAERLAQVLGVGLDNACLAGDVLRSWRDAFRARQFVEAWQLHGRWLTEHRPVLGPGVASRFATARATPLKAAEAATAARGEVLAALGELLPPGAALVLPSTPTVAPELVGSGAEEDVRSRTLELTCIAGLAGAPAVSLPTRTAEGWPVGICLIARPGEDERLLAAAAAFVSY